MYHKPINITIMDDSSFINPTEKSDFIIRYVTNHMSTNMGSSTDPKAFQIGLDNAKRSAELAWTTIIDDNLFFKLKMEKIENDKKKAKLEKEKWKKEEKLEKKFAKFIYDIDEIVCCVREMTNIIENCEFLPKKEFKILDKIAYFICDNPPNIVKENIDVVKKNTVIYKKKAYRFIDLIDKYKLLNKEIMLDDYYSSLKKTLSKMKDVETYQ